MAGGERVRAGRTPPRNLPAREGAVEHWLRENVAPAYDAMRQDPSRAVPAEQVLRTLRAHHAKRPTTRRGP